MAALKMGDADPTLVVIVGDPAEARSIRAALADWEGGPLRIHWAETLAQGVERLVKGRVSAVVLDLTLPDCEGLDGFVKVSITAPQLPLLILSAVRDEGLAQQAVASGANDYLLKTHLDSYSLLRAIRGLIERTAVEEALFAEKERAEVTLNSIGDAVLSTDLAGHVTYLNTVAEGMTGWGREEAAGHPLADVFHIIDGATREPAQNPMELAVQQNKTVGLTANCILVRRDGVESAIEDSAAPIHDRQGQVTGAVIVFHDVRLAREVSLRMSHLAHHDTLTDLPNRLLLNDRLARAIAVARRHRRRLAVLFVDIDHFKHMNDSLGHAIGDRLLQSVAARLTACVRSSDTVSRQGGDEFIVLLSEIERSDDAAVTAGKIIDSLAEPHRLADHELHMTVSVGVSVSPDDGVDPATLIERADIAMYHAKQQGRARFACFTSDMNVSVFERQSLEASLHDALRRQELEVHYQGMMDLRSGAIVGFEALVRWMHPERGLILPSQFVPIAEDCGLIVPIGQWVLRESCRQARAWQDDGLQSLPVSVNVSAVEFRSAGFLQGVREILRESRLESRYLQLELTEGVLMKHGASTVAALRAVKAMGVGLAIDDFGTGYSSLSHLNQFPIDVLKVDQSFVHEITSATDAAPIVSAVISMGKSLNHRVVAEGVETAEQLAWLRARGCDEGQGYYFSRPLQAAQFAKLLAARPRNTASV
jgi:diguanylate cyclase (GGDEF)-like protein/PAS domain S-box-containing protein